MSQITFTTDALINPCFRYLPDTLLIPFCNPTLQKGIRRVSGRYQKIGQIKGRVMVENHCQSSQV